MGKLRNYVKQKELTPVELKKINSIKLSLNSDYMIKTSVFNTASDVLQKSIFVKAKLIQMTSIMFVFEAVVKGNKRIVSIDKRDYFYDNSIIKMAL